MKVKKVTLCALMTLGVILSSSLVSAKDGIEDCTIIKKVAPGINGEPIVLCLHNSSPYAVSVNGECPTPPEHIDQTQ